MAGIGRRATRRMPRVELARSQLLRAPDPESPVARHPSGCRCHRHVWTPQPRALARHPAVALWPALGRAPAWARSARSSSPDGGFAILDFLNALTRHDYPANPDNKTYYTAEQSPAAQANEAGFRRSKLSSASRTAASCCCWLES